MMTHAEEHSENTELNSAQTEPEPAKTKHSFFASFLFALSFLTRIPCPMISPDEKTWRRALMFFPLAGLIIGIAAVMFPVIAAALFHEFSALVLMSSFVYALILQWLPRMLHFDGFCDACDGFSVMTESPERRLEVMKDSRSGSAAVGYGSLLLFGKCLAAFLIFSRLMIFHERTLAVCLLLCVPVIGRFAMVGCAFRARYPREKGTGSGVVGKADDLTFLLALVFAYAIVFALILTGFSSIHINSDSAYLTKLASAACDALKNTSPKMLLCFRLSGGVLCIAGCAVMAWRAAAMKKLGGVTGDILGAVCETSELAALIFFTFCADLYNYLYYLD